MGKLEEIETRLGKLEVDSSYLWQSHMLQNAELQTASNSQEERIKVLEGITLKREDGEHPLGYLAKALWRARVELPTGETSMYLGADGAAVDIEKDGNKLEIWYRFR